MALEQVIEVGGMRAELELLLNPVGSQLPVYHTHMKGERSSLML